MSLMTYRSIFLPYNLSPRTFHYSDNIRCCMPYMHRLSSSMPYSLPSGLLHYILSTLLLSMCSFRMAYNSLLPLLRTFLLRTSYNCRSPTYSRLRTSYTYNHSYYMSYILLSSYMHYNCRLLTYNRCCTARLCRYCTTCT